MIKMIIKGRSRTRRHVPRTHRVALDWLFERVNLDPQIQIRYIDSKHQLADILTKGNFTRDEWNSLLNLFNISPRLRSEFQLDKLLYSGEKDARTKRRRQGCGKIKADSHEPDFNCLDKFLIRGSSDCVENPRKTQSSSRET